MSAPPDTTEVIQAQEAETGASYFPPTADEINQQLVNSFASSTPQIASYFDSLNGSTFDIPQQQQVQDFPPAVFETQQPQAPPQFQAPPQQIIAQQFVAPAPATQMFEQFQVSSADNDRSIELQQQLDQQSLQMMQLKSELEFHRTTASNLQQNTAELNRLRQETHSHLDVVKVLVSEKSSLIDSLQKAELQVKSKFEENEELQNRLNMSRHRVKQLESEIKNTTSKPFVDPEIEAKKLEELVAARVKQFQESNEKLEAEKEEMKVLLSQKRIEFENLQKNFDHLNTELHLANVKIAQLSDGSPVSENGNQLQVNQLSQEIAIKQQQIAELYSVIDQVNRDKEASDNQYQNYVSHLTREMETLKESSSELSNENDVLVKREQELLKHVSDLERQIQQQIQKQKIYAENQKESTSESSSQEELQKLSSQIAALTESNENVKVQLGKIEAEKAELGQSLLLKEDEMRSMQLQIEQLKTQTPNLSQLMTDFEDKSVAASRALTQNQGLKDQLHEMQRAFIAMTNDKMELTEKLQAETHLCKEMKIRYDAMEAELHELQGKWQFKEDEMIRLSHENTELEKKILQQNIEIDRLRHYESKEYHGTEGILEKELENYKRMVETLTNKINVLETTGKENEIGHNHDGHNHDGHSHHHDVAPKNDHNHKKEDNTKQLLEEISMLKMEKNELLKAMHDFQMSKKPANPENTDMIINGTDDLLQVPGETTPKQSVTPSMATEEALEKLQARFRRTMLEVAELTEEKQRLEHVVTQLQFETETIGEYITLYQYQRRVLKQKEHERDVQLKNLAADRERMNEKLLQLNALIEKFVMQHVDNVELAKEASKFLDHSNHSEPLIIHPSQQPENMMKLKQETAGKILEILSDIKIANSTCYDTNVGVENCSCCLGKLETV